jgi:hypothetical protein
MAAEVSMNIKRSAVGAGVALVGVLGPAALAHADGKDYTGDITNCAAVGFPDAIGVRLDASKDFMVSDQGLTLNLTSDHRGLIWTKTDRVTILRILVKGEQGSINYRKYVPPVETGPLTPAAGGSAEIGNVLACITTVPGSDVAEFPLTIVGPIMALGVGGAVLMFPQLRRRRSMS